VREWLCPGGALAIDEHVGNSRLASSIGRELHEWAESEVLPQYRTLAPEALAQLPQEPHSPLEDSSVSQVVPAVDRMFNVVEIRRRHVFLDHYPLLYYLHSGRDLDAYRHALAVANQLQDAVRQVDPEGGDYVTIVAENGGQGSGIRDRGSGVGSRESGISGQEVAAGAEITAEPDAISARIGELEAQLAKQGEWAQGLEQEIKRKNNEIARLQRQIRRLENGRMMKLMGTIRLKRKAPPRR
jgi:uncharacterized coiled-coil protein SlyX